MVVDGDQYRQPVLINTLTEVVGGGQDVHDMAVIAIGVELIALYPPVGGFKGDQHRFVELAVLVALQRFDTPFGILVGIVATGITRRLHGH